MAHTFKTTAKVWVYSASHHDAKSLQDSDSLDGMHIANHVSEGWTHVGEADVTITVASPDQIVNNKVASLRAELGRDRAESQRRQNQMMEKINQLEALTYEAPEVA